MTLQLNDQLRERALRAVDKEALYGEDIDLATFNHQGNQHQQLVSLADLDPGALDILTQVGLEVGENDRSGTFLQMDTDVVCNTVNIPGVEVMDIDEALAKYDGLKDYYWTAVPVDTDKYTADVFLNQTKGYFIRVLPGAKVRYPIQSCLYIDTEKFKQSVHNIIIVEEGGELELINGCAVSHQLKEGLHIGVTEFFVKKDAKLTFNMIHDWSKDVVVRARTVGYVDEGGSYTSNYVALHPVKSIQMFPTTYLRGEGATARYNSILWAHEGSVLDVGGRVVLQAKDTNAEVLSRAVTTGGSVIARGDLIGEVADIKAHLSCDGLVLEKGGIIHAIPELQALDPEVTMSHEAAVGKVAQEEVEYLMSRGLSEEEATSLIIRGFLNVDIPNIGDELVKAIEEVMKLTEAGM